MELGQAAGRNRFVVEPLVIVERSRAMPLQPAVEELRSGSRCFPIKLVLHRSAVRQEVRIDVKTSVAALRYRHVLDPLAGMMYEIEVLGEFAEEIRKHGAKGNTLFLHGNPGSGPSLQQR